MILRVIKTVLWILLGVLAMCILGAGLVYVPPLQGVLCRKLAGMVTEATELQVRVEGIGLRFPLKLQVRGAWVADTAANVDTLLYIRRLDAGVQVWPLLQGRVEVDGISLTDVRVNSANLLPDMRVEGCLGSFFVASHGIDLKEESAQLNRVELADARVRMTLTDTASATPPDTASAPLKWRLTLDRLQLHNVEVDLQLLQDSVGLRSHVKELRMEETLADLGRQYYGVGMLHLDIAALDYDQGVEPAVKGLDVSHIALRDVHADIDSVRWEGAELYARLVDLGLSEQRSGLEITSFAGYFRADSARIQIPALQLLTPYSEINLQADAHPVWVKNPRQGRFSAIFDARIGKQDIMLLAGSLPLTFRRDYPQHPLRIRLATTGNLAQMQLSHMQVELPGAFALDGSGGLIEPTDSVNRKADFTLTVQTGNLDFLRSLSGEMSHTTFVIPDSMRLGAALRLQGNDVSARLELEEDGGKLIADAGYDISTEAYEARLHVDSLQLHHFLPIDSLYELSLHAGVQGRGTDFTTPRTKARAELTLDALHYGQRHLADIRLTAHTGASTGLQLTAGDLNLRFQVRGTVDGFIKQSQQLLTVLQRQIDGYALDHVALRRVLPSASLYMEVGTRNPLSDVLRQNSIHFRQFRFGFGLTPEQGINGRTEIQGLHVDSLQLDTLFFAVRQDTARMHLQGGVINGPENPQAVFRSTLTGEIRNEDAELTLRYEDGDAETGILLGVNARPLTEGHGKGDGVLFNLIPPQPIIAYRRFDFAGNANWIYLHRDMRVYAGVNMHSDDGIGLSLLSDSSDNTSLQNIQVALTRFRLSELSRVLPYLPRLTGLLSVEGRYIQTARHLQVSGQADVSQLTYEGRTVGDVGLQASWLPRDGGRHYLRSVLTLDDQDVVDVKGMLDTDAGDAMPVDLNISVQRLPLAVANAFVPDDVARLAGRANGTFHLEGTPDKPRLEGSLTLDSASVYVGMLGARYHLDNRPIRLERNLLKLDAFSIYTTSPNPLTITGTVDLGNLSAPVADLRLQADDYTLLDARRTPKSLVYGKVVADLDAVARGPVSSLTLRGNMHLLGTTDLTYVLTDSPLTVDDRLSGLVTFVSFDDTTSTSRMPAVTLPPGGMDVLMAVRIDDAVRLRADLSPDRSKYIELEGGGDLSLRYTPQGDMSLTGRYTLSDGVLKYALPVIPLKEFRINRGSYVNWGGDLMNPELELTATEQVRASVAGDDEGAVRMVDFDVSVSIQGKLSSPGLTFDIAAPHDATVQNELLAMGSDERSKQAIAMLATGIYLNSGVKGGGLNMGAALNSVLQSQINSLAGQVKGASISVGVEDRTSSETGNKQTDYSFRYAQRFFNDRVQIVIGGKVSTGAGATNSVESFIDNISLEYRLDASGTRYIRAFYNKNYESVLDGEITETGIGLVLRRKVDRLSELFIFRRKEN